MSSPAKISVGGGEAKTEPATAALRQPLPTYPEKAGSCPIQITYQLDYRQAFEYAITPGLFFERLFGVLPSHLTPKG